MRLSLFDTKKVLCPFIRYAFHPTDPLCKYQDRSLYCKNIRNAPTNNDSFCGGSIIEIQQLRLGMMEHIEQQIVGTEMVS